MDTRFCCMGGLDVQAEVYFAGQPAGTILWVPDAYGVQTELDCAMPDDGEKLLRCYGKTDGAPLLIGLPEPVHGRLRLKRHLSRETLKAAGCDHAPPLRFYLSDSPQPPAAQPEEQPVLESAQAQEEPHVRTGDEVLDSLLDSGAVQGEDEGASVLLRCAFAPDQPFALAPAFVLCTVENGHAALRWTKKDAAQKAASGSHEQIT